MRVNEIFYSIQGEGAQVGTPMVFLRLAGCDLSCPYCDTEFDSFREMDIEEILNAINIYPTQWVIWTGGEPLLQLTAASIEATRLAGYKQALETNGAHPVPAPMDWVTVSPKVAGHTIKLNHPRGVNELRYPWHSGKQGVPVPPVPAESLFLSPINSGERVSRANFIHCVELCKANPPWRISCQMQKVWREL